MAEAVKIYDDRYTCPKCGKNGNDYDGNCIYCGTPVVSYAVEEVVSEKEEFVSETQEFASDMEEILMAAAGVKDVSTDQQAPSGSEQKAVQVAAPETAAPVKADAAQAGNSERNEEMKKTDTGSAEWLTAGRVAVVSGVVFVILCVLLGLMAVYCRSAGISNPAQSGETTSEESSDDGASESGM